MSVSFTWETKKRTQIIVCLFIYFRKNCNFLSLACICSLSSDISLYTSKKFKFGRHLEILPWKFFSKIWKVELISFHFWRLKESVFKSKKSENFMWKCSLSIVAYFFAFFISLFTAQIFQEYFTLLDYTMIEQFRYHLLLQCEK